MSTTYVSRRGRPPLRFTRRGRYAAGAVVAALAVAAIAVLLVGALSVVNVIQKECVVTSGSDEVRLGTRDAEKAATAVARVIRAGGTQAEARKEVRRVTGLSAADAVPVAMALAGRHQAALSCAHGGAGSGSDRLVASGLTDRGERLRKDMKSTWPNAPLGGFAPGGVHSGHMVGSAHYEGRAIDAFFRPVGANKRRLGWAMAQYYVAQADRLDIETVIFDGRIWTSRRGDEGWRAYQVNTAGKSRAVAIVLEHRDHVHVDVAD